VTERDYILVRNLSQVKMASAAIGEVTSIAGYGLSEEKTETVKRLLSELLDEAFDAVGPCETEEGRS
jgi:hypothetical protein